MAKFDRDGAYAPIAFFQRQINRELLDAVESRLESIGVVVEELE